MTRLKQETTVLAVVDLQDKLLAAISERERVLRKSLQLIKGAAALNIPTMATVQYPRGLGPTSAEIAAAMPDIKPLEKMIFSACGATDFLRSLRFRNALNVILCGVETHVCVSQTCLDLLERGFGVFVAADATSSRVPEEARLGLERMRDAGAVIGSVEMALFELLGTAARPEFKAILGIVK